MYKLGFCVLLLPLAQAIPKDVVSYKGFRLYNVYEKGFQIPRLKIPNSKEMLSVLNERHSLDENNNPLTVRSYLIPRQAEEDFRKVLEEVGADYDISNTDVEKEIEEERKSEGGPGRVDGAEFGGWNVTEKYFSYEEICEFLRDMKEIRDPKNKMPIALVEPIGESLEGRKMHLVKISTDHKAMKPILFVEAGIHAREWTAPATALYLIYQLVANHTHNRGVLDDVDFYIIPLSNPDGYEYSRAKDRFWRKTRSFHKGFYGVDGNRNFDFHWGEGGTSGNPASEIYRGPFPFSEVETRNIRDVGSKYAHRICVFVTLHAYGSCILYPWSYKITSPAPEADVMDAIAKEASDAIKEYSGTEYARGSSAVMLYEAAGGSDDYFKGALGVDLTFTFELSDAGRSSFIIPIDKLQQVVAEAFVGFKVIARKGALYYNETAYLKGDPTD